MARTECPRCTRASTRCEAMNPSEPVMAVVVMLDGEPFVLRATGEAGRSMVHGDGDHLAGFEEEEDKDDGDEQAGRWEGRCAHITVGEGKDRQNSNVACGDAGEPRAQHEVETA